ncbi:MAG: hypothetical protein EOO04_31400, partial [Chitinophagaceae bacterium]
MTQILVFVLAFLLTSALSSSAQNAAGKDLYLQTSEMSDIMIQFDADRASINRFYSTSGAGDEWWLRQQRNDYNSPERRQRLLQLFTEYIGKAKGMDFDRMNINGKVDYLLFMRNLEDGMSQLLIEEKNYLQVAKYLPFSDRVFAIEKPRRRGIAVNGEIAAKELNDISTEVHKAIIQLRETDSIEMKQASLAADA